MCRELSDILDSLLEEDEERFMELLKSFSDSEVDKIRRGVNPPDLYDRLATIWTDTKNGKRYLLYIVPMLQDAKSVPVAYANRAYSMVAHLNLDGAHFIHLQKIISNVEKILNVDAFKPHSKLCNIIEVEYSKIEDNKDNLFWKNKHSIYEGDLDGIDKTKLPIIHKNDMAIAGLMAKNGDVIEIVRKMDFNFFKSVTYRLVKGMGVYKNNKKR